MEGRGWKKGEGEEHLCLHLCAFSLHSVLDSHDRESGCVGEVQGFKLSF